MTPELERHTVEALEISNVCMEISPDEVMGPSPLASSLSARGKEGHVAGP